MNALFLLVLACLPALPPLAVLWIVRYGPWTNRWWRGETVAGFVVTVTVAAVTVGFVVGATWGGNLGPPIGVIAALPVGLVIGALWGLRRARARD